MAEVWLSNFADQRTFVLAFFSIHNLLHRHDVHMGFFGSSKNKIKVLGGRRQSSREEISGLLSERDHVIRDDGPSVLLEKEAKPAERVRGDDLTQARLLEAQIREKDLELKITDAEIERTRQQYSGTPTSIQNVPRKPVARPQEKGQFTIGMAAVREDCDNSHSATFVSQVELSNMGVKLAQMTGDRDYYLTKLVELQNQEQHRLHTRNVEVVERDQRIHGLEAEVSEKESRWRNLKGRLEAITTESDQRIEQLEAQVKGLEAEVVEKDRTCRERGDHLNTVTNARDSFQSELRTSGAKLVQATKEFDAMLAQLQEDVQARSEIYHKEVLERDQRIQGLEAEVLEKESRWRQLNGKLETTVKERDSFQMELRTMGAKLAQASGDSDHHRREYHAKLAEYQKREQEMVEVQILNKEMNWELDQLRQQITHLRTEVADKVDKLKGSKTKLKAAVKERDSVRLELQEHSKIKAERDAAMRKLRNWEQRMSDFEAMSAKKDCEINTLRRRHEHDNRKWNDSMRRITMKAEEAERKVMDEMLDLTNRHRTELQDLEMKQRERQRNSAQEVAMVQEHRRSLQEHLEATEALLSQRSNRVTELEHQIEENKEIITETRLTLNRSRNEAAIEKRKAQQAAQEVADKNRKMEFLTQECARMALR